MCGIHYRHFLEWAATRQDLDNDQALRVWLESRPGMHEPELQAVDADPIPENAQSFGLMPRDKQRALASRGGKAAQAAGKSPKFTTETGRIAGRKGGLARAKAVAWRTDVRPLWMRGLESIGTEYTP